MSAYGEYKYGILTYDQYRSACRLEELQAESDEDDFDEEEVDDEL